MKSVLKALNLSKEYRKRRVVDNVSVEVKQGEIVGLLGPNGAGKTTTFYMICGMVKLKVLGMLPKNDSMVATGISNNCTMRVIKMIDKKDPGSFEVI
ncbi:MAG: ATP-binding protein, partial [Ignavibacteria bacterium]|nr:ATP-binding protein [Ignavibacteria bacterium]